jgi:KaiC/GvpD/RAD55 family RecA-like ATPase
LLATWFAEAVRGEVAALEKDGGSQAYEVLSGRLIRRTSPTQAILQFILADGTRIPEDATGILKASSGEYSASVIGQDANRIDLLIAGETLPAAIPRAILSIDDTALLKKLAEALEGVAHNPQSIGRMATIMFHPAQATVGSSNLASTSDLRTLTDNKRQIIGQASGSSLTYIWGPPGTGKTHLIAHLVTTLVKAGERVLVSSHTRVAVDQALYAAVKMDEEQGPLAGDQLVSEGRILRIGQTADPKVPDTVKLDKIVESKAKDLQASILALEGELRPRNERIAECKRALTAWSRLEDATSQLGKAIQKKEQFEDSRRAAEVALTEVRFLLAQRRKEIGRAKQAWFRRTSKVQRATSGLVSAEAAARSVEVDISRADAEIERATALVSILRPRVLEEREVCQRLPSRNELESDLRTLEAEVSAQQDKIRRLLDQISELEQDTIRSARAIFCTLTKIYVGKELEGQKFDAVIADEISMALPPTLFLASGRATTRVVLVGDFWQLPPIIRSDVPLSNGRLGTDTFRLAGVAGDLRPEKECQVLTALKEQHRMAPEIADVARHLVYSRAGLDLQDHEKVRTRTVPSWMDFLPSTPLIIVDTADLHCWSGKQVGSLSRFNFYSATVAVELAALASARLPEPKEEAGPPIGIVTPYAAQRRLLSRLVKGMELARWVAPGTVHTFQGGQADLVIFDSVLDEPYWSARLTTPDATLDVLRQLNVAVTRAKFKFVFVGSSEWMNKYAKANSGLGQLWGFLRDRAPLVSATEFIEGGFARRVAEYSSDQHGWQVPVATNGGHPVHDVLDETTFFDRFAGDIRSARENIFGLVPYFGEYRWPMVEPLFREALQRGVEVTLITPPIREAENRAYVEKAIKNLRDLGAIVVSSSGLHGKDIVIDGRVHYTGSLNWASHRGRAEVMHRTEYPELAHLVLEFLQAKFVRAAAVHQDGKPRVCPECGGAVHVVNQRVQRRFDMRQALKIGCESYQETGCKYLRDIDERAPLTRSPICQRDGRTKYRRVRRGKGEIWQCPKHPRECPTMKVVPGDP